MPMNYFGEPWDVPAVEDAEPAPTPVGKRCAFCPDVIVEGDQGFLMGTISSGPDGEPVPAVMPVHRECMVRSTVGSVEHLEGRCTCFGGDVDENDNGSWREQGLATMRWLNSRGGHA